MVSSLRTEAVNMADAEKNLSERARFDAEWWDTATACAYLHITSRTLQRWRKSGRIQGYQAGRYWLYRPDDVRALVRPAGTAR